MKYKTLIIFYILFIGIFCRITGSLADENSTQSKLKLNYISRGSIVIDSDNDFIVEGFSGSGTEIDPYIIENYYIEYSGTSSYGISVFNTNKCFVIRNCYIDCNGGIFLQDINSNNTLVENVVFVGITLEGMRMEYVRNITLDSLLIHGSYNSHYGIYTYDSSNLYFNNVTCKETDNGIWFFTNDNNITIENSNLSENREYGLVMSGSIDVRCNNVETSNNGDCGIYAISAVNIIVDGCQMLNNEKTGFLLHSSTSVKIKNCVSWDNSQGIILRDGTTDAELINVSCKYNEGGLIIRDSCSNVIISDSFFTDNDASGMTVTSSGFVYLENSNINDNGGYAVTIQDGVNVNIIRNNISRNFHGIWVGSVVFSTDHLINQNYFVCNSHWAIQLSNGVNNTLIYQNYFFANMITEDSQVSDFSQGINWWYNPLVNIGNYWDDYDGLGSYEIISGQTDEYPLIICNNDLDGDTILNNWEVENGLDPLVDDTSLDYDNDGLTNLEEYQMNTDPQEEDSDNDNLTDGEEVNTYFTNPLNSDSDFDFLPDGWEVLYGTNATEADDMLDYDNDGLTNYEEFIHKTDPFDVDTDNDTLTDYEEIYVHHTSPSNSDSDRDGLDDGEEVNTYNTDPLDKDTDDDLLTDGEEVNIYNTDPLDFDTDDDQYTDGQEVKAGTDPLDPESHPIIITDGASGFSITISFLILISLAYLMRNQRKKKKSNIQD